MEEALSSAVAAAALSSRGSFAELEMEGGAGAAERRLGGDVGAAGGGWMGSGRRWIAATAGADGSAFAAAGGAVAAGRLEAEMAFAPAAEIASRLLGFAVTAKWMERMAKRVGAEMAAEDARRTGRWRRRPSEAMCCGIDGTGVPVRPGGVVGSQGKHGGKVRTREAKVVAFRSGDGGAAGGATRRSAAIDSAASRDADAKLSPFAARLWRETLRSGFALARVKVVLGDGAKWIWNVASELFPGAVEIVDLWHAREHLWEVGRAVYGAGTALCEAWAKKVCAALSEGRLDDVLEALRRHAGNDEARRCVAYVEANRARMRYPEYRATGLPAGSGVVERARAALSPDASSAAACAGASTVGEPRPDAPLLVAARPPRPILQGAIKTAADGVRRLSRPCSRTDMSYTVPSLAQPRLCLASSASREGWAQMRPGWAGPTAALATRPAGWRVGVQVVRSRLFWKRKQPLMVGDPRFGRMRPWACCFLAALVPVAAIAQPAAPDGLLATPGDEEAALTWSHPSNPEIMRYEVRFSAGYAPAFNAWAKVSESGADTVEHTVSGLVNGTHYVFELRAVDAGGSGEPASTSATLAVSPSSAVEVPDVALRTHIGAQLELADEAPVTQGDLATLRRLEVSNASVHNLAGLEFAVNIESLSLPDNAIANVAALSGLTTLQQLDLAGNAIADISALSALTSLTRLDLRGNEISDVTALSGLTSLQHLDLGDNDLVDVSPLSGLTELRRLFLRVNTSTGLSLANLPALTELQLAGTVSGLSLSHLPSLRSLSLSNAEMTDVSMTNLPALTELWLSSVSGRISLSRLTSLRRLELRGAVTDLSLTDLWALENARLRLSGTASRRVSLSRLASLTQLDLAGSAVAYISLTDLPSLMLLDLSYNQLADVALRGLNSLQSLELQGNAMADISALSGLASVTTLRLSDNEIVDVSALSDLTSLTNLFLSSNKIADISALSTLTSLRWLELAENEITDVSALAGLTSLAHLSLSGNKIVEVSALSRLTSLQQLNLSGNALTDISALSKLTSLQGLNLSDNAVTDVSALSALTSLTGLSLSGNNVADVSALSGLTGLRWLDLSGNPIMDASALSGLTSLQHLDLRDNATPDILLADLPALTNLELDRDFSGRVSLSGLASLERLDLSDRAITGLSLTDLSSLQELFLARNQIADMALSGLTSLTTLDLQGNVIADISALSGLNSLWRLDLSGNAITEISALSGVTSLSYLYLSGNAIADLSPLSGLTLWGLHLSGNAIADVAPLSGMTSLRKLELSDNEIGDISPLSELTLLVSLHLSSNEVVDVSALSGLAALQVLDLSDNKIVDFSPLSGLTWLSRLYLSSNEIVDVSALSAFTSLRDLDLSGNAIVDLNALSSMGMIRLSWLDVSGNQIANVAALSRPVSLTTALLYDNAIADISPLVHSAMRVTKGYLDVRGNPLNREQADHVQALRAWQATVVFDDGYRVPLFPSAGSSVPGFVRVINHSGEAGSVSIEAVDETGERRGPVSLSVDAGEALHFNANDLEQGNPAKGLRGVGEAVGKWRLVLRSELDIEVLGYARTPDGFVTSLHDLAPEARGTSRVPTFNPGSNQRQVSRLRLANPHSREWAGATIVANDDTGQAFQSRIPTLPHQTRDLTAAQIESGQRDFAGMGDGKGKWRLGVEAPGQQVMSLLQSPTGHLANISTGTAVSAWRRRAYYAWERGGRYRIPLFLGASREVQGFLRIVNRSQGHAAITLRAFDESGAEYQPARLTVRPGGALHFNSDHLEAGNAAKGLPGIGAGTGDWHLEVSADRRFEVLAYARTTDGFVTSLHDAAPRAEDGSLWIPFFNPGSNPNQISRLRLVNWGETAAEATIAGIDDRGSSPGEAVRVTVPARSARDYTAFELETGSGAGLSGALGDGSGKWRLRVSATGDIDAMSLLELPTGHITNLSTTPRHPPKGP